MTKSYRPTEEYAVNKRKTILINASGWILGRLAAKIAYILMGKHKAFFMRGVNCGDNVIVFNTSKIEVTGKKMENKIFYRHTGYIGNLKSQALKDRMAKDPSEVVATAVKRMIPKGVLGRKQFKQLSVFSGEVNAQRANNKTSFFDFDQFFGGIN